MKRKLFKADLQVPYSEHNGVITYIGYGGRTTNFIDNKIFKDKLEFKSFSRGRSSVKAHFVSQYTGRKYEMFIIDFEHVITKTDKFVRLIEGEFCFRKAGSNYGVALLED